MYNIFQDELIEGEQILWIGQPETSVIFTAADFLLIPFSLLWGGFVLNIAASIFDSKSTPTISFPFNIIPIIFSIIGLYFIFGRFLYKNIRKKKTFYAITNKRILAITSLYNKNIQASFINTIPAINKSLRKDGIGTIRFGNTDLYSSMYGNTGMELFLLNGNQNNTIFYDIKDAEKVYELVNNLRNQKENN